MKLKDQHIFVTGGADGIGRAVVQDAADAGAKVSFCDLNVEKGKAYEAELRAAGHQAFFIQGNVGQIFDHDRATLREFRHQLQLAAHRLDVA